MPRGRPLGSKNKPKPSVGRGTADDAAISRAQEVSPVKRLDYAESVAEADAVASGKPANLDWLRAAVLRARLAVLDDIIEETSATPEYEHLLASLRLVRATYAGRLRSLLQSDA